jgi:Uri superfamily endonuclease
MSGSKFTLFGNKYHMGSYILFIRISSPVQVAFGKFQKSNIFTLPESDYLYIGSALGNSGTPLAARLIRHAGRSGTKRSHNIRKSLIKHFFGDAGALRYTSDVSKKKLHWHIDYLLDCAEAEIEHIVIIRCPSKIEHKLSAFLDSLEDTCPIARRLGAQDTRNSNHLLRISDRKQILEQLGQYIPSLIPLTESA